MSKLKTAGLACTMVAVLGLAGAVTAIAPPVSAQQQPGAEARLKQKINAGTVAILGGSSQEASLRMAHDIARAMGNGDDLRILPVSGNGGAQAVRDILYLEDRDIGFVTLDTLDALKNDRRYNKIKNRLAYIAKLHNEEFHLISDGKIASIGDLKGKAVAFHGAGSEASGRLLLSKLGIEPAKAIKMPMDEAALRMKSGEVHAVLCLTGKPLDDVDRLLKLNPALRLASIEYTEPLMESYLPATLTAQDYPGLVAPGQSVETVAVGAILAVNNLAPGTDRYRRLERFAIAFFSNFHKLAAHKDRHPKWREVNLAARLPGWKRFKPAADRLAAIQKAAAARKELMAQFAKFLEMYQKKQSEGALPPEQRDELFNQFVDWQKRLAQ
ncbi:MAG: ABC transporter substrate-binding protein [Hyphomicrobiales bacterium]|nr:ABC transporter substrate-binding protein [Hyphomicrobiales bacterium]